MSFSITNNSAQAVIAGISTLSETYGSLTITGGTFPLQDGDTITGVIISFYTSQKILVIL